MRGITSTSLAELEAINKKINDWMLANIANYKAQRWGNIVENQTIKGTFVLIVNEDSRNPIDRLNLTEKTRCIEQDTSEWFPKINLK